MQRNFIISRKCIKKQSSLRNVVTALKKEMVSIFRNDKVENQLCFSDINRYLKNYNSFEGVCEKSGVATFQSSNTWKLDLFVCKAYWYKLQLRISSKDKSQANSTTGLAFGYNWRKLNFKSMMGKELRIRRIVCYTGTSHNKAFVSSEIKFHD